MAQRTVLKEGEDEARRLVEFWWGKPVTPWDDGGGHGSRYDFNIGEDGALEVTSLADEGAESVLARANRATISRPSSRLTTSWAVEVELPDNFGRTMREAEFRGLAERIEDQLVKMERCGEVHLSRLSWRVHSLCVRPGFKAMLARAFLGGHHSSCPFQDLAQFRVVLSAIALGLNPSKIFFSLDYKQACNGPNDLLKAIEQCLEDKPDNWQKLTVSGKTERQIFFWARQSQWCAQCALRMEELPNLDRKVEEEYGLTGVWAGIFGQWDKALFWRPGKGWIRVQTGEDAQSA